MLYICTHPFQLQDLPADDASGWHRVGDWYDSLVSPTPTSPEQAVSVRFQVDRHVGPLLMHCHSLDHADASMALLLNVTGTERPFAGGLARRCRV